MRIMINNDNRKFKQQQKDEQFQSEQTIDRSIDRSFIALTHRRVVGEPGPSKVLLLSLYFSTTAVFVHLLIFFLNPFMTVRFSSSSRKLELSTAIQLSSARQVLEPRRL